MPEKPSFENAGDHEGTLILERDDQISRAVDALAAAGLDSEILNRLRRANPVALFSLFATRQDQRIAARVQLHSQVSGAVRAELGRRNLDPEAMSPRPPDTNFTLCVKRTNEALARQIGKERGTPWSLEDFRRLISGLNLVARAAIDEALKER